MDFIFLVTYTDGTSREIKIGQWMLEGIIEEYLKRSDSVKDVEFQHGEE